MWLHDSDHVFNRRWAILVIVEYFHVFLELLRGIFELAFFIDPLNEFVEGHLVIFVVPIEQLLNNLFFIVLDEELHADSEDKGLELIPVETVPVFVVVVEDFVELAFLHFVYDTLFKVHDWLPVCQSKRI